VGSPAGRAVGALAGRRRPVAGAWPVCCLDGAGPGAPGIRRLGWGRPMGQPGADRTPRPANPPPARLRLGSGAGGGALRCGCGAAASRGAGLLRWGSAAVGRWRRGADPPGERQRLPGAGRWGELAVRGLSRGDCDRAVWTLPSAWDFFLPQREGRARGGPGRVWAARLTGSGAARPPAPSRGSDGQQMPDRRASPQIPGWCVVNRWRPSAGRRCRPGAGPVWWRCRAGVPAGAGALKRPSGPRGGPPAARAATGRIREWRPSGGSGGRPPGGDCELMRRRPGRAPKIGRRRVATGANHPASQSSAFRRGPGTPAGAPTGDQSTASNATTIPPTMHQTRNTFEGVCGSSAALLNVTGTPDECAL
jgi:hypothetical protein